MANTQDGEFGRERVKKYITQGSLESANFLSNADLITCWVADLPSEDREKRCKRGKMLGGGMPLSSQVLKPGKISFSPDLSVGLDPTSLRGLLRQQPLRSLKSR